jgi:hypothetical protein
MAKKETIDLEVIKEMHPDCFDTPEDCPRYPRIEALALVEI